MGIISSSTIPSIRPMARASTALTLLEVAKIFKAFCRPNKNKEGSKHEEIQNKCVNKE